MGTSAITDPKKDQNTTHSDKIILSVFGRQGPIPEHYHEKGPTVHSAHYCTMLCKKLMATIRSRCQALLSKVCYHCMTMPTHILPSNCSNHQAPALPSAGPWLPSDQYILVHHDTMRDHQFASEQKMKELVHKWLVSLLAPSLLGIYALRSRQDTSM